MVVFTSLCPINSWIVRISVPESSKWVAKECRRVWAVTRLFKSTALAAFCIAFCKVRGEVYHRRASLLSLSNLTLVEGKRYCHWKLVGAFLYFLAMAKGNSTKPQPRCRSSTCSCLRFNKCFSNGFTNFCG